nr:hypothetical protein CFP56_68792 [Quercus suber]
MPVYMANGNIGAFKRFLQVENSEPPAASPEPRGGENANVEDLLTETTKPKVPSSVVLQGTVERLRCVVFLFPHCSDAGTAQHTLRMPEIRICPVALNSPQAQHFTCSIDRLARLWQAEMQPLQAAVEMALSLHWSKWRLGRSRESRPLWMKDESETVLKTFPSSSSAMVISMTLGRSDDSLYAGGKLA